MSGKLKISENLIQKYINSYSYLRHLLCLGSTDVIQVCQSQFGKGLLQRTRVY